MNIIFMGTPQFAVPSLKALIKSGYQISAVVTQPDRPVGRKQVLTPPPVKKLAEKENITVFQPERVKDADFIKSLKAQKPDVIVVVAYGQILSKEILEIPSIGCINVHASILPEYRGAAPIQWAIIDGKEETGVTTMWMDEGLDTGDIFKQKSIKINDKWSTIELAEVLADLGADLLIDTLNNIENGELIRIPQDDEKSSYASLLRKEHGKIEWNKSAKQIYNQIRGLHPWPGVYTIRNGKKIKILKAKPVDIKSNLPGEFMGKFNKQGFLVGTGKGCLLITHLQEAGKKKMDALSYLAGHPMSEGERFADI